MILALLIDLAAQQTRATIDLTDGDSLSLTAETERILATVDEPTTITAFLDPADPERAAASALFLRYQRLSSRLRVRILDPGRASGEMRRLGVDPELGGVAVARGSQVEVVSTITEQDLTGALARLARGRSAELCFATGRGEASTADESAAGLSSAAATLRENGYRLRDVDLLVAPQIPDACDALVLAASKSPLGAGAAPLAAWLEEADGRLLVLSDPAEPADPGLSEIVSGLGLGLRRGIVLEGDARLVTPDDPSAPVVRNYPSANPIVRRLAPTFFPGAQQVTVGDSDASEGLTATALAQTSPISYLETEPLAGAFDPSDDAAGPIVVAGAADRVRQVGGSVRRSRAVVVGDVDFATNAFVGEAANADFLVRTLDWLSLDDQLVVLSTNLPEHRPMALTKSRILYARFITLVFLPGLFLLLGAVVWAFRRTR